MTTETILQFRGYRFKLIAMSLDDNNWHFIPRRWSEVVVGVCGLKFNELLRALIAETVPAHLFDVILATNGGLVIVGRKFNFFPAKGGTSWRRDLAEYGWNCWRGRAEGASDFATVAVDYLKHTQLDPATLKMPTTDIEQSSALAFGGSTPQPAPHTTSALRSCLASTEPLAPRPPPSRLQRLTGLFVRG